MSIVAFRMDDITADMDWHRFYRFRELFDNYSIKPLIGVVPDNKDKNLSVSSCNLDFWDEIRSLQSQGWSIAQHGYQHVYETDDAGLLGLNERSEFASLSYQIQYNKIIKGKNILLEQGIKTNIWMAPAHSYDRNTLKALKEAGFKYVTDGYALYPYMIEGLKFIPCQCSVPWKIPFGVLTVCIHANTITDEKFALINSFIKDNRRLIKNYHELLMIPPINFLNSQAEKAVLAIRRIKKKILR